MSLLSLRNVSFTWGGPLLLDTISLEIDSSERIGLLGRNGAGKSTLMRIIAGELDPDDGVIRRTPGLRIGRLVQEVPEGGEETVAELIARGWQPDALISADAADATADVVWKRDQAVDRELSRMKLDGAAAFATLSSGMKRRALLARALVCEPDIVLLDEPTNHLDIESITWLEGFLKSYRGALVFVTHDRVFLQALATRIIEINRGRLFDWTCDYATFLKRKQSALDAEEKQNLLFDKKLAREEVWIRQGIKARRTRNEGRVRALKKMRIQRCERRQRIGNVHMQAVEAQRSGQLVIEVNDLSFAYGEHTIVEKLSTLITRGDKVGIVGPNGSGKTTLLKLLLGELEPTSGSVRHGTNFQVIYFDQLREQIDAEKTVVENVGEGEEMLLINGRRQHIYGYLQNFLFTPERARRPARFLSGGERNRLLLARLFKRPSNLMVLDEPTNDLDTETLELLEELITNYSGTLLLVSHDRAFLNNVVTGTLVFEGDGQVKEYDGGYDDYIRQCVATETSGAEPAARTKKPRARDTSTTKPARLSYKERQELETLPDQIDALEQEQRELHTAMSHPSFFKQDGADIAETKFRLETLAQKLDGLYARWEELAARE